MRSNPLENNPKQMTLEELRSLLAFYGESIEQDSPQYRVLSWLKYHVMSWKGQYVSAELLSSFLEDSVLDSSSRPGKRLLGYVLRRIGLFYAVRLSELSPIATAVYLDFFAIPRKKGVPALPDKKFGWIGLEKVAEDPKAALYYYAKLVRPVERASGQLYEDARSVLARGMAKRGDTALCAVALFDFEPTTEMRAAALRDLKTFGTLAYLYFAGEEIDEEARRAILARSSRDEKAAYMMTLAASRGDFQPAAPRDPTAHLSPGKAGAKPRDPGFSQRVLSAPALLSISVLLCAAWLRILPSRSIYAASDFRTLRSKLIGHFWFAVDVGGADVANAINGDEDRLAEVLDVVSRWHSWKSLKDFHGGLGWEESAIRAFVQSFDASPALEDAAISIGPEGAYEYAKRFGPSDKTRAVAFKDERVSFLYAKNVDRGPNDLTREAASRHPKYALKYAMEVDRGPHDVTRYGVRYDHELSLQYALEVDKGPHPVTRAGACTYEAYSRDILSRQRAGESALRYAVEVDRGPHDLTRIAASAGGLAVMYALQVDKGPHPVTRAGACMQPRDAEKYALFVDRRADPMTFGAVRGTQSEDSYVQALGTPEERGR